MEFNHTVSCCVRTHNSDTNKKNNLINIDKLYLAFWDTTLNSIRENIYNDIIQLSLFLTLVVYNIFIFLVVMKQ